MRGIYIVGNDKVVENSIALLNSIRLYDPTVPIFLIPFNEDYKTIAAVLQTKHNVQLFPDLALIDRLMERVAQTFDRNFLALPNKMRKIVQWFGPLDEFLYIDTDIVVFEKIADVLDYLDEVEFLCCDYHFSGRKLTDIFSPIVQEQGIFTNEQLQGVFNSGFWATKKSIFTEDRLFALLEECANHREYFDFSHQTTDQPLLNYLILKATTRRINLAQHIPNEPGNWGGSPHFEERDQVLYDKGKRLRYLHWAGIGMEPGAPYYDVWEYYRYWGETPPPRPIKPKPSLWSSAKQKLKSWMK